MEGFNYFTVFERSFLEAIVWLWRCSLLTQSPLPDPATVPLSPPCQQLQMKMISQFNSVTSVTSQERATLIWTEGKTISFFCFYAHRMQPISRKHVTSYSRLTKDRLLLRETICCPVSSVLGCQIRSLEIQRMRLCVPSFNSSTWIWVWAIFSS